MRFRKKSGGKPAFPTSRFLDLRNRFSLNAPGGADDFYQMTYFSMATLIE